MFRFKWGRLLSGGILLTIMGLVLTINAAVNQPERYTFLDEISYKRLSDDMLVQGRFSRIIGKYTYDFGEGEAIYYVAALPANEDSDTKYVSVNTPVEQPSWDMRIGQCRDHFDNGTELYEGKTTITPCKLHKMTEDDLTAAYAACEGYVQQGDILPFYTEPYYINYKEQAASTPEYPIGVGIVVLVLGLGAVTMWVLRPVISKKDN